MARLTDHRALQSEPVPVHYAGFYSDTQTLGQSGWHLALEDGGPDHYYADRRMLVVLHHRDLDQTLTGELHGTRELHHRRMRDIYEPGRGREPIGSRDSFWDARWRSAPHIELTRARRDHTILVRGHGWDQLRWRATEPTFTEADTTRDLRHLPLFAQLYPDTRELIVEPQDVQQLLDQILAAQGPARKAIRQRELRRERDAAAPPRQVHAQIVSLMAA